MYNSNTIEVVTRAVKKPEHRDVPLELYNTFFKKTFYTAILKPFGIDYLAELEKITPEMVEKLRARA